MFILLFVINILLINNTNSLSIQNITETHTTNQILSNCLINILNKHLENSENIATVVYPDSDTSTDEILLKNVNKQSKWGIYQLKSTNLNSYSFIKLNYTINCYLIQTTDIKKIHRDLHFLKYNKWNPDAKFIIIITDSNLHTDKNLVLNELNINLRKRKILNAIVLLPQEQSGRVFDIYTWLPFYNGSCGNCNDSFLVDVCQNGVLKNPNVNLFRNKIPRNLNRCPVRVRAIVWPPYILAPRNFNSSKTRTGINFTRGIEINLLNTIAKAVNFKTVYSVSSKIEDWGYILENGSALGIFESLMTDEVDIGIGSLAATINRFLHLTPSLPYTTESLSWCVPSAVLEPKWRSIFNMFKIWTWVNIYVTFIILSSLATYIAQLTQEYVIYKEKGNCFMIMLAVFLGLSVKLKPRKIHLKTIFSLCAFLNLIISAVYQTSLISFLTDPAYDPEIKDVDEIFEKNLSFLYLPATKMYFAWDTDDWKMQRILKDMIICEDAFLCLANISKTRDYAMALPRLYLHYVSDKFKNKEGHKLIHWFKEDIMSYPIQMFMQKGFPLTRRVNSYITRIVQSGILEKWQQDLKYTIQVKDDDIANQNDDNPENLTLSHLQGAFIILCIGIGLSVVSFIGEVVYFDLKKYRKKTIDKKK